MIGATKSTIQFSSYKIDRFNRSLVQQIEPHLKKLDLDKELLKFTGDGWLLITPHSNLIPQLCCLALIQRHCFQKEMATKTTISEDKIPPLRIALCQGRDIAVNLPDGRQDWVGDSARRATRAVQHCVTNASEILIQDAIVKASSLNRDFKLIRANIETRADYEKHKKEEPVELYTLQSINAEAAADADVSPFYVYTLNAIGLSAEAQATAEKASKQILEQAAEVRDDEPDRVDRVLLPRWDRLAAAIPNPSFVGRMTQRRRDYGLNPSAIPYNICIRDSSAFPQAVDWFERMRQDGIAPNVVTYSTLVSKAEDYATAKDWFERMRQDGIAPNEKTTSALFAKDLSAVTAEELLNWYWSQGYRRGEPLQAAIQSYRKAQRVDEAFRIALHYPYLQAAQKLFRDFSAQIKSYLMGVLTDQPDHPDVHYALGVALMEGGENTEAETHLRAAEKTATQEKRKRDIEARLLRLNCQQ
jgi:tetratricopeptide (TPR) repeat protein